MTWSPTEELARRATQVDEGHAIAGRRSSTVLIEGDGLRAKLGIGAPDLPFETWLSLENRFLPSTGPQYDKVTRVRSGMVLLDVQPLQGRDQTSCSQPYITVGLGKLGVDQALSPGDKKEIEGGLPEQTYAWRVVSHQGRSAVLTVEADLNSTELVGQLQKGMRGVFHVERIDTGVMTTAASPLVPGWHLLVAPAWTPGMDEELDAGPAPGRR